MSGVDEDTLECVQPASLPFAWHSAAMFTIHHKNTHEMRPPAIVSDSGTSNGIRMFAQEEIFSKSINGNVSFRGNNVLKVKHLLYILITPMYSSIQICILFANQTVETDANNTNALIHRP